MDTFSSHTLELMRWYFSLFLSLFVFLSEFSENWAEDSVSSWHDLRIHILTLEEVEVSRISQSICQWHWVESSRFGSGSRYRLKTKKTLKKNIALFQFSHEILHLIWRKQRQSNSKLRAMIRPLHIWTHWGVQQLKRCTLEMNIVCRVHQAELDNTR